MFVDIHWLTFPQKHIEVRVQHNFDDARFGAHLFGGGVPVVVLLLLLPLLV